MENTSDDSQSIDGYSLNNGTINSVFLQETNGSVPVSTNLLNRQYYSDTSINDHSLGNRDVYTLEDDVSFINLFLFNILL